jgi:hypothetical protein
MGRDGLRNRTRRRPRLRQTAFLPRACLYQRGHSCGARRGSRIESNGREKVLGRTFVEDETSELVRQVILEELLTKVGQG